MIPSTKLLCSANGYILQAGTVQQAFDSQQMLCLCSFTRDNEVCKFRYEHKMSLIGSWQIKSRALPELWHPSLPLCPIFRLYLSQFHQKLTLWGTEKTVKECSKNIYSAFLPYPNTHILFEAWSFITIARFQQLLPTASDDIFWVTCMFDNYFMDTFSLSKTNFQIRYNCINTQTASEDKSTSLCFPAAC